MRLFRRWRVGALFAIAVALSSCATGGHRFTDPTANWQARSGQLLYHDAKTTIIGEVLVRYSAAGDFELTFSKGPGLTLVLVRQDANFVRVSGPLARGSWSGPPTNSPARLRGWVALRDRFTSAPAQSTIRYAAGGESFVFHF